MLYISIIYIFYVKNMLYIYINIYYKRKPLYACILLNIYKCKIFSIIKNINFINQRRLQTLIHQT